MKAQLLFRDRRNHTQTFTLKAKESILGRDAGIAVPVSRDGISRHHARILMEGEEYTLEDLRSTNGTFLNGQAVARDQLRHLDVIGLGKSAELIFVLRDDAAVTVRKVVVLDASLLRDAPGATPEPLPVGEVTVGRSSACNITSAQGPVSKIHCKILRTQKQVTLEDLGSSNGTFVNGERVMTTVLHDGDILTLGGVEVFKVKIELGEVTSASGVHEAPATGASSPRPTEARRFSADWKTRYEWDPNELAELAELQKKLRAEDEARQAPAKGGGKTAARPPAKPGTPPAKGAAAAPGAKPAAPAPKAAAAAPAKPAAPAAAKEPAAPKDAVAPKAPPPAREAAPAKEAPAPKEPAAAVAKPVPAPAPMEAPPAPPAPAPAVPAPAAPIPVPTPSAAPVSLPASPYGPTPRPSTLRKIAEVRLQASGVDVAATATGAHELGRDKAAGLRVSHPTVSRQHARVIISDDRSVAYIQDRGGANGTRLNGVTIKEIQLLNDGDTVSIGDVDLKVAIRRE